jgi:membrane-bound lytic murein transglycosylase D
MRPNAKTLPLLFALCISPAVGATEPTTVAAAASTAAAASAGAQAAAALPTSVPTLAAAKADEPTGAEALPPAAVPAPRLVRSAAAQARSGVDRPDAVADDGSTDSPEIAAEVDAESAELEDLRRAEQNVKVETAPTTPAQPGRIALLPELDHDLATLQAEYDIPIDVNPEVVAYVRFLQSPVARKHFVKWLGRSYKYMEKYREILRQEGLPQDTVFLAMIESGFANFAYSRAKASGPWQFIASTGRLYGLKQDFWIDERRDPERAAHAAARFLKRLHDETGDWRLAWAGYNAGLGRIFKAQQKGFGDFWSMAAQPGKKVLRSETKGYVPKLMAAAIITKHQEAFGFKAEEIEREAWTDYAEVEVPSATLLSVLAQAAGVPEKQLIELNPELRRSCTPPHRYLLKIPAAAEPTFAENWPTLRTKVRTTFAGHVVRRGDSISKIAALYGVPVQGIVELNGIRAHKRLRPGTELLIPRPMRAGTPPAEVEADAKADAKTEAKADAKADAKTDAKAEVQPVSAQAPTQEEEQEPKRSTATPRVRPVREAPARAQGHASRTVLRIRHGDTLWSISQRYGVDVDDLCRWNRIKSPNRYKLVAGRRLVVYPDRG